MNRQEQNGAIYRFEDVAIDSGEFRVTKTGESRHITPRAFEVLIYLVENAGRIIGKQELFDEVWKENFVTDNALTRMIKEIRQVIGDEADAPVYIETVPKRGYRFIAEVSSENSREIPKQSSDTTSIAVLPFTNVSADDDSEYLSEAITESVINNLSQLQDLRVVPRSVVFSLGAREINPFTAGRDLKVKRVATGRVLHRGENLIVSAELVDIEKESQIWGEKYQYKTDDIFDLQEEISQKISERLEARLILEKNAPPTANAEAYRLYLKGRYFWNRRPQGLFKGIEYFERSREEDPNFALAYAGIADSYSTLGSWENGTLPPDTAMPKACAAAAKALELNPSLAEAHTTLGYAEFHYDWNFAKAEKDILHALSLNKNYVHAHHWLSHIYMARGETEKSHEASRRALELDPLDLIINVHQAWHFWLARESDKALQQAEKTRELDTNVIWASFFAGLAYAEKGLYEEAATEFRRAESLAPPVTLVRAALGNILGLNGETAEAKKILNDLENQRKQKFVPAYDIALVRLGLGETASAIDWLNRAADERSGWMPYLTVEPRLDALRSLPEFKALLKGIGFSKSESEQ